jgi:peptide/nickel transport system permease protein
VARYLLTRLAALLGIVFVVSVMCFLLVHMIPGDPAKAILQIGSNPISDARLDRRLGLDNGIFVQYWQYLVHAIHGNLGNSYSTQLPVSTLISGAFKVDLELVIYSQVIAYLLAVPLAVWSARRPGSRGDQTTTTLAFGFYSLPAFILVVWLIQLLTIHYHAFPGPGSVAFPSGGTWYGDILTNLHVMLLPSLVLAIGTMAVYYRLLRGELVLTLQEDFITAARAKGLTTKRILWRHALRPSMSTLLSATGNNIALLITGLFIIEIKFGLQGIGTLLYGAVGNNDYLLVQGIALVAAIVVVIVNFGIDLISTFVDPRLTRA